MAERKHPESILVIRFIFQKRHLRGLVRCSSYVGRWDTARGQVYRSLEVCSEDVYLLGKCHQRHHLQRGLWMDKRTHKGCQRLVHKLQSSHKMAKAQGSTHGTLKKASPHSSSGTKLTSLTAKLCPLWESTLGPVPDSLTEIFPQMSFAARGHLRGNQVEADHALSSKSVLKRRAGVMAQGDESSEAPARTCWEPHLNGDMLSAGGTDRGLHFPPQKKRRDRLSLVAIAASHRVLPPTKTVWCSGKMVFPHQSRGGLHCPGLPLPQKWQLGKALLYQPGK